MNQNQNIMNIQQENFFLDDFTKDVCIELSEKINPLFQISLSHHELAQAFSLPPDKEWGHWALPCFFLSKKLKKNPAEIAQQISTTFDDNSPVFEKVVNKGPYLNFFFQKSFLKKKLLDQLQTGDNFRVSPKKTGSYLIEYSQPNTHKELHIGHTRNLCFGLSLVTLLKKRGFPVISCTYPGDMGTHVAKCLWYLTFHNKDPLPLHQKGQWLGAIYTKAYKKFEQTEDSLEKEKNKKQVTHILQQLQKNKASFTIYGKKPGYGVRT